MRGLQLLPDEIELRLQARPVGLALERSQALVHPLRQTGGPDRVDDCGREARLLLELADEARRNRITRAVALEEVEDLLGRAAGTQPDRAEVTRLALATLIVDLLVGRLAHHVEHLLGDFLERPDTRDESPLDLLGDDTGDTSRPTERTLAVP